MAFNLDKGIEQLLKAELLSEQTVKELCQKLKQIMLDEPNIVTLQAPLTVCGDIHGQFYDLLELFKVGGFPPNVSYLFLGNLVDRGYFSVETLSLVLCLKLRFPNRITILRGNHESASIAKIYGFYSECVRKYGNTNVFNYFCELFNFFPLAAVINDKIFCVHGGLSPQIVSLDQLRVLDRFREVPEEGPMTDLLWSDPELDFKDPHLSLSPSSTKRTTGSVFSQENSTKFCKTNHLDHIVRGHQLCMDGYSVLHGGLVSTVWSAPNFAYKCGNVAAILEVRENLDKFYNTFTACPESERVKPKIENLKEIPDYYRLNRN